MTAEARNDASHVGKSAKRLHALVNAEQISIRPCRTPFALRVEPGLLKVLLSERMFEQIKHPEAGTQPSLAPC